MALNELNYINLGPHGTFEPSGNFFTTTYDIDNIFEYIKLNNIKKIAIHFHGGLVNEDSGMKIAEEMVSVYESAGSHPICFVWETGLLETIKTNLEEINQTRLYRKILFWVIKKTIKNLDLGFGARGGLELTNSEIEMEFKKDYPFEELSTRIGARGAALPITDISSIELEVEAELEEEMEADEEFKALLIQDQNDLNRPAQQKLQSTDINGARGIFSVGKAAIMVARIIARVLYRFIKKHDHGIVPTIVEEILRELYLANFGAWVWQGMKDVARDMWLSNSGLDGNRRRVGKYFIEKLADLQQNNGVIVDLIGHSAGSIAIAYMLKAISAESKQIHIRNILLLAPAARTDLFYAEIGSKPERYQSLRTFTMSDKYECEDRMVGSIYPRSLLYFISGVLEDLPDTPIVGMERFIADKDGIYNDSILNKVRNYFTSPSLDKLVLSDSLVLNPGASAGFTTSSRSHGGFDNDQLTRDSITSMLN